MKYDFTMCIHGTKKENEQSPVNPVSIAVEVSTPAFYSHALEDCCCVRRMNARVDAQQLQNTKILG